MAGSDSEKLVVLKPQSGGGRRPRAGGDANAGETQPRRQLSAALLFGLGGGAATLAWLALAWRYFAAELGWQAFDALLLHEKALIVIGVATPVAALWLAIAYAARGRELREVADQLRAELKLPRL